MTKDMPEVIYVEPTVFDNESICTGPDSVEEGDEAYINIQSLREQIEALMEIKLNGVHIPSAEQEIAVLKRDVLALLKGVDE